jgi:hypothetical protein
VEEGGLCDDRAHIRPGSELRQRDDAFSG